MYKLVAFLALLAVCTAAPKPSLVYTAPVVTPVVSPVVPAVTSYSAYSSDIIHGSPIVPVYHSPVVHTVHTAPVYHPVPLTYSTGLTYL